MQSLDRQLQAHEAKLESMQAEIAWLKDTVNGLQYQLFTDQWSVGAAEAEQRSHCNLMYDEAQKSQDIVGLLRKRFRYVSQTTTFTFFMLTIFLVTMASTDWNCTCCRLLTLCLTVQQMSY